jgi:hypothetical protein
MVAMEVRQQDGVDRRRWVTRALVGREHVAQRRVLEVTRASIDKRHVLPIIDEERVDVARDDAWQIAIGEQGIQVARVCMEHLMGSQGEMAVTERDDFDVAERD